MDTIYKFLNSNGISQLEFSSNVSFQNSERFRFRFSHAIFKLSHLDNISFSNSDLELVLKIIKEYPLSSTDIQISDLLLSTFLSKCKNDLNLDIPDELYLFYILISIYKLLLTDN